MRVVADSLNRVMNCNGSHVMPASYASDEVDDTTARDEGTAFHYMAKAAFDSEATLTDMIDRKAPNGFYMTAEMAEHAADYLAALDCGTMETDTSYGGDGWYVAGRCDHEKYNSTTDTQIVDDVKYGWRLIDPDGNWTLISHAIGLALKRGAWPAWSVLRIHQPRPYHPDGKVREWRIDATMLYGMYQRIAATLSNPSDTLVTGLAWCQGCHALATCPAARAANYNAIDAASTVFSDTMQDGALAYELDVLSQAFDTIKARREALQELAKHRLKSGAVLAPNETHAYQLENTYGHRKWKPGTKPEMVLALTGKNVAAPQSLITPAAAERAGVSEDFITAFTDRPSTGTKLVRVNVDAKARRMFKQEQK